MDKNILKKFAIEAKKELTEKITDKISMFYVDEEFKIEQKGYIYILSNQKHSFTLTSEEYKHRNLLIKRINDLSKERVIEEATYTWFNRIIAIRYMEINDILPLTEDNMSLGIRVLSSKDNTPNPEILKFTNLTNRELDIDVNFEEYQKFVNDNQRFKYVLLLVCQKLRKVIPQVFDGLTDYIDILLPDNLLNDTGFVTKLITEVPEDNYNQVEIIGWLYQYYNQAERERVISAISSKKAYNKDEIPYATQIFTPDWIVKYMVENSLGRYWVEHSGDTSIIDNWKYFINEEIQTKQDRIDPTKITFLDPCCGSGHVLVYAFEVFYQIYLMLGYNKNNIPELILKNNLYGLDIDDRAGQMAILSVLLKACEYDRKIFNKKIVSNLNIMSIQESNSIKEDILDNIKNEEQRQLAKYLVDIFKYAKEIGALLLVEDNDYEGLEETINKDMSVFGVELKDKLLPIVKIVQVLAKKYDVVVTNPPYMNSGVMPKELKAYVNKQYKDYKKDLFAVFIIRNLDFAKESCYVGFMTPNVWMFNSSYEKLRGEIIQNNGISSLIQLAEGSFNKEAKVDICSFVLKNNYQEDIGRYFRLVDFSGGMEVQEQKFLDINANKKDNFYLTNSGNFNKIQNNPIAYWASEKYINILEKGTKLGDLAQVKVGIQTGDTNKFLRQWYEVNINKTLLNSFSVEDAKNSDAKWFPHNKGGEFRKWYGNNDYVVDWENDGYKIKNFRGINGKLRSRPQNIRFCFMKSITWTDVASSKISFRSKPYGHIFDVTGMSCFLDEEVFYYVLGLNNTNIVNNIMKCIAPTLHNTVGDVAKIPVILDYTNKPQIDNLVESNIALSKFDWDSFELSWDFAIHPLLSCFPYIPKQIQNEQDEGFQVCNTLEDAYNSWVHLAQKRFNQLKSNEEELNRIFIDIYGLSDELTPEVEDKAVTVRKADRERDIKSLISYAVGCMFGRYSLDQQGLIYAGGEFDQTKYSLFKPTQDNIIPITDEEYFENDIVKRFKEFIKVVYGQSTFNQNMDFIAETLGKRDSETSEDTIRRYFVNDFYKDHVRLYKKRPIYWLFDSGKKNGFKALIYMHRFDENLVPKLRLDYLHKVQAIYERALSDIEYKLTTDLSLQDKKATRTRQAYLNAKLGETKEYDEKIAHIANQRISIDLDDGVAVNYDKFKDVLAKLK